MRDGDDRPEDDAAAEFAEEQLGFDSDEFFSPQNEQPREEPALDGFEEEHYEGELREEAYSSNYPDNSDDFILDGDLPTDTEGADDNASWAGVVSSEPTHDDVDNTPAEELEDETGWDIEESAEESEEQEEITIAASKESSLPPLGPEAFSDPPDLPSPADEQDSEDLWEENTLEDEGIVEEATSHTGGWPLGLIIIAVLALILLAAGGYGIMQQRAAANEEIRELRASLATAVTQEQVSGDREQLKKLTREKETLASALEAARTENRQLTDTVAGLEAQLRRQADAAARAAAVKPEPATKPAPAKVIAPEPAVVEKPKPTPAKSAVGSWFVNFSSYGQRETAEGWRKRLQPDSGRVIVAEAQGNGGSIYRVRVVDLSSRDQAERVARQLEQAHGLDKLWVGQVR